MGTDKDESLSLSTESQDFASLRRQAEERLRAKTTGLPLPPAGEETQRLIHELEVHQIELEMQNAELCKVRDEVETTLDKYTDLYDFAPVSYFTLDRNGIIRAVNLTGAGLLRVNRSQLIGRRFGQFVTTEARPAFVVFLSKVFASPASETCETELLYAGDSPRFVQIEAVAAASGQECRIALIDITERKRSEEALQNSQLLLRSSIESQKDTILLSLDRNYQYLYFNKAHRDSMLQAYNTDVRLGMNILECITSDEDRQAVKENYDRAFRGESHSNIRIYGDIELVYYESFFNPILNDNNEIIGVTALARNITERKKAGEALRESNAYLENLINYANAPIIVWDPNCHITRFNHAFEFLTGRSEAEVIGQSLAILFPPAIAELSMALIRQTLTGERWETVDIKIQHRDGSVRTVLWNSATIFSSDGQTPLATIAQGHDITERKRAQEELQRDQARFRSLANILQHPVNTLQEFLDYALKEALELSGSTLGYIYFYHAESRQFILNTWSREVMQECSIANPATCYDLDKTGIWGEAVRQRQPIVLNDFQAEHPLKKGYPEGHAPLHNYLTIPVFNGDVIVAVVAVANKTGDYDDTDVRQLQLLLDAVWECIERKRAEEGVRQALAEKETLIRELYHRTKNNMQIVRSLMNLKAIGSGAETRGIVTEMDNLIHGLALVHQMLYQSRDLSNLDLTVYLDSLARVVARNFWGSKPLVSLDILGEPLLVTLDIATPCGLVLNELLSNTFKYAFPDSRSGVITIRILRDGPEHLLLEYADNGVGLPEGFDPRKQETLGMQSLFAIVEQQLSGEVRIVNAVGLGFVLRIATSHYQKRV
jgi:PAS domain S-box-containing protein